MGVWGMGNYTKNKQNKKGQVKVNEVDTGGSTENQRKSY
jgi:hypothetical protein